MATDTIEKILQELATKPIGIEGVMLVSQEGQPLAATMGIDENMGLIMAAMLLNFANITQNELNWSEIDMISMRGQEGHLILTHCNPEVFLLIKAGKTLKGVLEGEIKRTIKKLQAALQAVESRAVPVPPVLSDKPPSHPSSTREVASNLLSAYPPPGSYHAPPATVIETTPTHLLLVHPSGQVFSIGGFTLTEGQKFYLGRRGGEKKPNPEIDLTELPYSERVSRPHAHIFWNDSRYLIVDNQSTNGTILNDQLLEPWKPYPLSNDDRLEFGKEHLLILTIKLVTG